MAPQLAYIIVYVSDMDRAIEFYRDTLGFALRFSSPKWSEFSTGATSLALHRADPTSALPERPQAGTVRWGINVSDLDAFYRGMQAKDVKFTMRPTKQDYGGRLAAFLDPDGAVIYVAEPMEPAS